MSVQIQPGNTEGRKETMSMREDLALAREYTDRMWTAEGTEAQHDALCRAVKCLTDIVEQQTSTIERLEEEVDSLIEAKAVADARSEEKRMLVGMAIASLMGKGLSRDQAEELVRDAQEMARRASDL